MEDASELAYQLSTIESVVRQANEDFVQHKLSALLETAGDDKLDPAWYGKLNAIMPPPTYAPSPVTEAGLDGDWMYNGPLDDDALKNPPIPLTTKSMFRIFWSLMHDVNPKWVTNVTNNAYMDSYMYNMDGHGVNPDVIKPNTSNWYTDMINEQTNGIAESYGNLDTSTAVANTPGTDFLQLQSAVGMRSIALAHLCYPKCKGKQPNEVMDIVDDVAHDYLH